MSSVAGAEDLGTGSPPCALRSTVRPIYRKRKGMLSEMPEQPYVVIRLVPESPVDGATFGTYLDELSLQILDAHTGNPLSDLAYYSPLNLFQWPGLDGYFSAVSAPTSESTTYHKAVSPAKDNYGSTLTFDSTDGIPVGSYVFSSDVTTSNDPVVAPSSGSALQVIEVTPHEVKLNDTLANNVPVGTVVSFVGKSLTGDPTQAPAFTFTLPTSSAATTIDGQSLCVLHFSDTSGVTIGMTVTGSSIAGGTTAVATTSNTVTVSQALSGSPTSVTFTLNPPYSHFSLKPTSGTPAAKPLALKFTSGGTNGVAVGMMLSPVQYLIAPGTTVIGVTNTKVTLSQPLLKFLSGSQTITFAFPLSSGIVQHVEQLSTALSIPNIPPYVMIPAAVATAVIQLNPPPPPITATPIAVCPSGTTLLTFGPHVTDGIGAGMPVSGPNIASGTTVQDVTATTVTLSTGVSADVGNTDSVVFTIVHSYLDINIKAIRTSEIIPFSDTFYNVPVIPGDSPFTPDQYPAIPDISTSLYLTLPPRPGRSTIPLTIPSDGSAPLFDDLYGAIESALANDTIPGATVSSLISSPANCTRIAYDIIWSYQTTLPLPPDPLESLATNPPNPGGGGGNSPNSSSTSPNFEQDRMKFEGTLNSFYSVNNANAERLAKFVAAASAAVSCEQASLNCMAALATFPADPSSAFAAAAESELLLEGLGIPGTSGINFGVPAAFFYALGANLDKTTTAAQRFQMATGDAIERLLQEFSTAVNASVITDSETFTDTGPDLPAITSFQAARRLVALGVPATSSSPSVTVLPGSPLASLVNAWLAATDPGAAFVPNPPLTYQNTDFNIWTQQLAVTDPQGYLDLDLDALTQGYVIPPFATRPNASAASGSTLVFDTGNGIGVGMPVSGPGIAPGTTVSSVTTTTTMAVTLSAPISGTITPATVLVFNSALVPVTMNTITECASGASVLTFSGTIGLSAGMSVFGEYIVPGTTIQSLTSTTVTLSASVSGDVSSGEAITFGVERTS